ncbi:MAG: hypothetical protein CL912_31360 [Deltaproteobacteria bacterium]|nr:hypothetical protein [Deltaproteobacteria bacterium]
MASTTSNTAPNTPAQPTEISVEPNADTLSAGNSKESKKAKGTEQKRENNAPWFKGLTKKEKLEEIASTCGIM